MNWLRDILLAAVLATSGCGEVLAADDKLDPAPIRIASFDWTSSALTSTILAKVLVSRGYSVQLVASSSLNGAIGDLSSGTLTLGLEYRMTGADSDPASFLTNPGIEDLGALGPKAAQVWWYPDYVKTMCPGLPDLKALAACAPLFSSPQSNGHGLIISGPVGWGYDDDARIAALGLPFDVVHVAADTSIGERVEDAVSKREPILVALGLPNWINTKYKGEVVAAPRWTSQCDLEPSWGTDPIRIKDCAGPESDIRKLAWAGMKAKWPKAWAIAKKITFDDAELSSMLLEIDYNGKPLDMVAQKWIDSHAAEISTWAVTN